MLGAAFYLLVLHGVTDCDEALKMRLLSVRYLGLVVFQRVRRPRSLIS